MKGPAILIAQFLRDEAPFDRLDSITRWVAEIGYVGVQIPSWDARVFDLDRAAESQDFCDDYRATLADAGLHLARPNANRIAWQH